MEARHSKPVLVATLAFIALCLVTYSYSAQAPKNTATALVAFDAINVKIGNVVGISYTDVPLRPIISMKTNEVTFVLELFRNRFGGNMREVFFQTNNCTGAAFLADSEQPLPFVTVVSGNATWGIQPPPRLSDLRCTTMVRAHLGLVVCPIYYQPSA
jgi:hypothetical protein